jgi:polyferredoxin
MSATALPRARRPRRPDRTARLRRISQATFAVMILSMSLRHVLAEASGQTASIDALCPFGAVETVWRFITTGQYVPKTHPSNLILGAGLLIGIVLAGSSFCGWVCPFGALQDALTWVRRTLHIPEVKVPARADRILRYGRFVTLGLILFMTVSTVKLWFAAFDPYRTLFGLEWLVDFNLAYVIVALVVVGSLLIQRFWCRYLCPLGGLMSLLGHVSFLRIRRNADNCKGCALCNVPCPVGIDVANARKAVSTNCIGCLACVQACPRGGTLEVQLAPTWLDPLNRPAPLVQPAFEQAGQ